MAGYDFDEARRLAQSVGLSQRAPLPDDMRNLSEIDLGEEMVAQYNLLKRLQSEVLSDPDVPANQKAQVSNAVTTTIKMLVDTQTNFYTHERQRRLEGLLIRHMRTWPLEQAQAFLDLYAAELTNGQ
jgi:hypothetical protein